MKRLRKLHDAVKNRFAYDELSTRSLEDLAEHPQGKRRDLSVRQLIGTADVVLQGGELRAVNVVGGNQHIDRQVINPGTI
jgi:hypothetical protein